MRAENGISRAAAVVSCGVLNAIFNEKRDECVGSAVRSPALGIILYDVFRRCSVIFDPCLIKIFKFGIIGSFFTVRSEYVVKNGNNIVRRIYEACFTRDLDLPATVVRKIACFTDVIAEINKIFDYEIVVIDSNRSRSETLNLGDAAEQFFGRALAESDCYREVADKRFFNNVKDEEGYFVFDIVSVNINAGKYDILIMLTVS